MNFRPVAAVAAVAFLCGVLAPATAAAGVIGLTTSLTGSTAGTSSVELTIDFDMNGAAATNLVGVQLYVGYSGLTPGAYALGSAFPSTLVPGFDYIELNGDCSDPILDCNSAVGDPGFTTYYLSSINLFPPAEATVPGTLFTLQFAVDPLATDWSLNLFGEEGVALLSDPCDFGCTTIPFVVTTPGSNVDPGVARLDVSATTVTGAPTVVPEPATVLLVGTGLVALIRRRTGR